MHGRHIRIALLLACCAALSCDSEKPSPVAALNNAAPGKTPTITPGLTLVENAPSDFGDADYGQTRTTKLTIRNDSSELVNLQVTEKSCACAQVTIQPARLSAGESCQVTLTWIPKIDQAPDQETRLWAVIQDREARYDKVRIEAKGRLRPALYINLPHYRMDFGRMQLGDLEKGKELAVEIYTRDPRRQAFTLTASTSNPGLQVVDSSPARLESDRLARLHAVHGYRVTLRCQEGLPMGRFREMLRLHTDVYPDKDLEIPVEGHVDCGAVSLSTDTIQLPEKISVEKGYHCPPIEITLRGQPNRSLKLVEVEPKFLAVELVHKRANVWSLKVRVPAGEKELRKQITPQSFEDYVSFGFDGGTVTLATDHSLLPVLKIPVTGSQLTR